MVRAELVYLSRVRDVKVDAYWKFSGSDNLDEVLRQQMAKEGF